MAASGEGGPRDIPGEYGELPARSTKALSNCRFQVERSTAVSDTYDGRRFIWISLRTVDGRRPRPPKLCNGPRSSGQAAPPAWHPLPRGLLDTELPSEQMKAVPPGRRRRPRSLTNVTAHLRERWGSRRSSPCVIVGVVPIDYGGRQRLRCRYQPGKAGSLQRNC
jgi:hypothetical protein